MEKEDIVPIIILIAVVTIAFISFLLPIIINLTNRSDCQEFCNRAGYERSTYSSYSDTCECSDAPDPILTCVNRCGNKDSHYNEFTGRCYCT